MNKALGLNFQGAITLDLAMHTVTGLIALILFAIIICSAKGTSFHQRLGRWYEINTALCSITSLIFMTYLIVVPKSIRLQYDFFKAQHSMTAAVLSMLCLYNSRFALRSSKEGRTSLGHKYIAINSASIIFAFANAVAIEAAKRTGMAVIGAIYVISHITFLSFSNTFLKNAANSSQVSMAWRFIHTLNMLTSALILIRASFFGGLTAYLPWLRPHINSVWAFTIVIQIATIISFKKRINQLGTPQ